jgi:valyl-tRNA synthetase
VLSYGLSVIVRLLHPFAPFVAEEIWQALPHDGRTIVTASWPDAEEIVVDAAAAARYENVRTAARKAREFRAELQLQPRERLTIDVPPGLDAEARALLAIHAHATLVDAAALAGTPGDPLLAATPRAPMQLLRERYGKEVVRLDAEIARLDAKLANEKFVANAAADKVEAERSKRAAYVAERSRAQEQLARLDASA